MAFEQDLALAVAFELELEHHSPHQGTRSTARTVPYTYWWTSYASVVTVPEFRAKFRMWPETLCELVSRLTGCEFNLTSKASWIACVATREAKYIAHAACLLIHGM